MFGLTGLGAQASLFYLLYVNLCSPIFQKVHLYHVPIHTWLYQVFGLLRLWLVVVRHGHLPNVRPNRFKYRKGISIQNLTLRYKKQWLFYVEYPQ